MQHHKYSLTELENMMPWEREIYMGLLLQWVKEENERIEKENAKMNQQRGTKMAVEVTVDPEDAKKVDRNGDGHISQGEMEMNLEFKRKELEDADARRDAMRKMTWFALMGMLLYPLGILVTSMLGYEGTAKIIGDIAPTYFVAISALVAAYFGANAYVDKKKQYHGNQHRSTNSYK